MNKFRFGLKYTKYIPNSKPFLTFLFMAAMYLIVKKKIAKKCYEKFFVVSNMAAVVVVMGTTAVNAGKVQAQLFKHGCQGNASPFLSKFG